MNADDYRLCQQVSEDLIHLREAWTEELSESVVRRESPIIRRLLVDGDYSRAWRIVGLPRQPTLEGHDLDEMLGSFPLQFVSYAFPAPSQWTRPVGRGKQSMKLLNPGTNEGDVILMMPGYIEGQGVLFAVVPKDSLVDTDPKELAQKLNRETKYSFARPFWLSEYLDSSGAYVNGERITRRQIIDFVANAMGGAHYSPNSNRISKEASRSLLKPLHVRWRGVRDVHAAWVELMSIGQSVARSTDAMRYCKEFDQLESPTGLPLSDDD